jgi:hypothetical protein
MYTILMGLLLFSAALLIATTVAGLLDPKNSRTTKWVVGTIITIMALTDILAILVIARGQ